MPIDPEEELNKMRNVEVPPYTFVVSSRIYTQEEVSRIARDIAKAAENRRTAAEIVAVVSNVFKLAGVIL
jgi:hypothetical protein